MKVDFTSSLISFQLREGEFKLNYSGIMVLLENLLGTGKDHNHLFVLIHPLFKLICADDSLGSSLNFTG
jgi:hypothetical protein